MRSKWARTLGCLLGFMVVFLVAGPLWWFMFARTASLSPAEVALLVLVSFLPDAVVLVMSLRGEARSR